MYVNCAGFLAMGFLHSGFVLATTAPETCRVWNRCWKDITGSKLL